MDDKKLFLIALSTSLFGILALALLSAALRLEATKNLDDEGLGKKVAVAGTVLSLDLRGNVSVMTIATTCDVRGVVFDGLPKVRVGERVRMVGSLQEFKGRREIIIEKIELADDSPSG